MFEANVSRDTLPVKRDVISFGREVLPFKYRSGLSEYNRLMWYQYVTYGNMGSWQDRSGFVWFHTGEHALSTPTPEERASTYVISPKMLYSLYG